MDLHRPHSRFEEMVKTILGQIVDKLDNLVKKVVKIQSKVNKMAQGIEDLKAQNAELIANVTAIQTVEGSVVEAFNTMTAKQDELIAEIQALIDAGADPVAIQEVVTSMTDQNTNLKSITQALADAVAANVPPVVSAKKK